MDFGTLLHMAKKNNENSKSESKYYSTKYGPPKKVVKEKKLSENIQKFLQKRDQEEKERQRSEREKLANLLAMRDEKSKNKIKKMLKVTKSANKSVLDDAVNSEHTAVTMEGPDQPDQDDYGYVSTEANAFYQKYIEKVKDVKEDKGFAPSRPQSLKDLSGTKERVKAAITKEIEEKKNHVRQRTVTSTSLSSSKDTNSGSSSSSIARATTSSRNLYDPEAERREEERKKREEDQKKAKNRKPPPPPLDFQALLKLAEKKQHEPIEIMPEIRKKKEPERLLTLKEKRDMEERQRAKEARERRIREGNAAISKERKESGSGSAAPRMEPNGRIPKLGQPTKQVNDKSSNNLPPSSKKTPSTTTSMTAKISNNSTTKSAPNQNPKQSSTVSKISSSTSTSAKPSVSKYSTSSSALPSGSKNPYSSGLTRKNQHSGPTREFPPNDMKSIKSRQFPPPDVQKTRQFPPADMRKGNNSAKARIGDNRKAQTSKRRIIDDYDDEDEYDSELDDFIDDGDADMDYSSAIKAIFGYDKSKYRNEDDDDAAMESNFAQVQREEFISKKIGLQEDLEDMKMEAMEKKRKTMKKRRLHD